MTPAAVQVFLDARAKPPGSLGRLERLAERLAVVQGSLAPVTRPARLVLFAGDHGVAPRTSAWPQGVTGAMVRTIAAGRAASSCLAAAVGADLRLVDVGTLAGPLAAAPGFYRHAAVARGTADSSVGPAMTVAQFEAAWAVGAEEARAAAAAGVRVLAGGEMGIGNTTPAACLAMRFAGIGANVAVGPGAGSDAAQVAAKRAICAAAVERAAELCARDAAAALGGLEIAAMAGLFAEAAGAGLTLVLDGYVATAAALVAEALAPGTAARMIAAHRSAEPGHGAALARLGLEPLLEWDMRLGEGTGALLAMPMLDAAAALFGMASLEEVAGG